uniref:TLDc domain-containing protein n=1 Tax=Rhizophagus irregularis (strain DAOM 181602 / DAOM 197198 / MUCL 43194) TaxID=747089 RepID=U9T7A4_RHIID
MLTQFFTRLSENYIEILNDDEYYDITIEVGKDPNNNDSILTHINLSDISPEIFQIILEYIYGGIISFNEQETLKILNVLVAADQLQLQELVDYLQKYLIENKVELMKQNFGLVYQTSFQSDSLLDLQQFCIDCMTKHPQKMFKSLDFTSLSEKSLVSLIKRDDLQMKEVEIWDHVLKWGLTQNSSLISDPDTWTDDDYEMMKNTLQLCLPLIRFFSLSSEEFLQKVHPYKKLLKPQLYDELFKSYLNPNIEPSKDILLPRYRNVDGIIDSKIVNLNIVSLISRWIDKLDIKSKFAYVRELYLPYKFKLLLRGSQDGFTPKKFHELCDNLPCTVIFIKVKGTDEIIGGYNPLIWKCLNDEYGETKDSFIFSFKSKNNFKDPILSHVNHENINRAIFYHTQCGPTFGRDLYIGVKGVDSDEYHRNYCGKYRYEKEIRNTEDVFSIEDYEVFQIVKS